MGEGQRTTAQGLPGGISSGLVDELARRRERRSAPATSDAAAVAVGPAFSASAPAASPVAPVLLPVEPGLGIGLHETSITALAAVNSKHAVSADGELGILRLWRAATPWRDPVPLGSHGGRVTGMVEVEGRLVTTGVDRRVLAWDVNGLGLTYRRLGTHDAGVTCVVALPGGWVVTGGHDGRLIAWSASTPAAPREVGVHPGGVNVVAASASGRVVSAGHDGRLLVWDLAHPGAPTAEITGLRSWTLAAAILGDGRLVTASGPSGDLRCWDVAERRPTGTRLGRHEGWVFAVIPLQDTGVATVGGDEIVLWDPDRAGPVRRQALDPDETWVAAAPLWPRRLVVGGATGRLQQWRMAAEPSGHDLPILTAEVGAAQ